MCIQQGDVSMTGMPMLNVLGHKHWMLLCICQYAVFAGTVRIHFVRFNVCIQHRKCFMLSTVSEVCMCVNELQEQLRQLRLHVQWHNICYTHHPATPQLPLSCRRRSRSSTAPPMICYDMTRIT